MEEEDIPEGDFFCSRECKDQHDRIFNSSNNASVAEQLLDRRNECARNILWFALNDIIGHDAVKKMMALA